MQKVLFIGALASMLKLLFIPMYRSTDFEVHRNWLALTHNLSYDKWYYENTSEWTLDYPPFFAWFEFTLSQAAQYFDDKMLIVENLNYASDKTILFQRLSVIVSDFLFFYATYRCCSMLKCNQSTANAGEATLEYIFLAVLLIFNAGLLMVDHIHFQYNGFLTGIFFLSLYHIMEGRELWGALWFTVLLNFKHIYLYVAPAYGIFLFRTYCMNPKLKGISALFSFSLTRLMELGAVVIGIFAISFGPFKDHIPQVLSRLFPFKRGLTHAYWAPNFWALYNFSDKILSILATKLKLIDSDNLKSSFSKGLVEEAEHSILPSPSPLFTMVLTLLFVLPCLVDIFIWPRSLSSKQLGVQFLRTVVHVSLTSFMFGWHVHEKAILLPILPLTLLAIHGSKKDAEIFLFLQAVGHYSLFPLLFQPFEFITKVCLALIYGTLAFEFLRILKLGLNTERASWKLPLLGPFETMYIYGLFICEVYCTFIHSWMPFADKLQFLPLMIVSSYCAIGVTWSWVKLGHVILSDCSGYPTAWGSKETSKTSLTKKSIKKMQ